MIRIIKSRKMGWAEHVARIVRRGKSIGFSGKIRERETTWKTET
jgi:hypothetical protein